MQYLIELKLFLTSLIIIFYSGTNLKTSQRLIPGTSRSAIITRQKQGHMAVEVHRIKDIPLVDSQDYTGVSELVINVGFATTTSCHGPQPYESPEEWQDNILHVLKTWKPEHTLFIRSGSIDMLRSVLTAEFVDALRESVHFDAYESEESGGLNFDKM